MFTVKHVSPNGLVNFFQTPGVTVHPSDAPQAGFDDRVVSINPIDWPVCCLAISDGDVFVMNAAGKTVDKYLLGHRRPPGREVSNARYGVKPRECR